MEKLYVTMAATELRQKYFPKETIEYLETLGEVTLNPRNAKYTEEELIREAPDATVLVTHWGAPQITARYLDANPHLKMIVHCAGTVAHTASEETYRRGIPCLSANYVMAKYVAEGVLGHLICGTHCFKQFDLMMQQGIWNRELPAVSLIDCTVGIIGLGAVARNLLDLMAPLEPRVKVYDPYLKEDSLAMWPFAQAAGLEEVMQCDAVTVHAAQTPETFHMIGAKEFALMKDNALFINTARGSLVDTEAAAEALKGGRIRAIFDVYEEEGVSPEKLRNMGNVTLNPHVVGMPAGAGMTWAVIRDIPKVLAGEKSRYEIGYETWQKMTQE